MQTTKRSDKQCKLCGHDIPYTARLCSICGSYQNWLGGLNRSGLVLSLLVALVSVLSIAIPAIRTAVRPKASVLTLQGYYFTHGGVGLILRNTGSMPGFVESCKMHVFNDGKEVNRIFDFNLRSETQVVRGDTLVEMFWDTSLPYLKDILDHNVVPGWEDHPDGIFAQLEVKMRQYDGAESTATQQRVPLKDFYFK